MNNSRQFVGNSNDVGERVVAAHELWWHLIKMKTNLVDFEKNPIILMNHSSLLGYTVLHMYEFHSIFLLIKLLIVIKY